MCVNIWHVQNIMDIFFDRDKNARNLIMYGIIEKLVAILPKWILGVFWLFPVATESYRVLEVLLVFQ